MRRVTRTFIAAALLMLIACDRTSTQTNQSTPTPTPTKTGPAAACLPATGGADSHVHLTDVRVDTQKGFDRVIFEFKTTSMGKVMPRYRLDAATAPFTEEPTGDPIEIQGESFAQIIFQGASGYDTDQSPAVETHTGPKEIKPGFEVLVEAERTGDFEATLYWAFGLSRPSCWKVTELADPLRLTIDFSH